MSWDLIFQHLFIVLAASLLSIAVGLQYNLFSVRRDSGSGKRRFYYIMENRARIMSRRRFILI